VSAEQRPDQRLRIQSFRGAPASLQVDRTCAAHRSRCHRRRSHRQYLLCRTAGAARWMKIGAEPIPGHRRRRRPATPRPEPPPPRRL